MKKFFIFLAASLFAVSVMAQNEFVFEKGMIRVGGASNLNFTNVKVDGWDGSTNTLLLGVDAGYFVTDNVSIDVDVSVAYIKDSEDDDAIKNYTLGAGLRYWFPSKFFVGGGLDMNTMGYGSESASGTGLKLKAGMVHFLGEKIAIEPVIGYRMGLSDEDKGTKQSGLFAQFGISVFF